LLPSATGEVGPALENEGIGVGKALQVMVTLADEYTGDSLSALTLAVLVAIWFATGMGQLPKAAADFTVAQYCKLIASLMRRFEIFQVRLDPLWLWVYASRKPPKVTCGGRTSLTTTLFISRPVTGPFPKTRRHVVPSHSSISILLTEWVVAWQAQEITLLMGAPAVARGSVQSSVMGQ
jgi:hypothetical protein